MKILAAIANYGIKNMHYLEALIAEYRAMPYEVDIVVLSNVPKDLGPAIEVMVGLPSSNPRSLPFAHKPLFAQHVNDYDLFIYSEDDTLVTARNLRAFLEVTPALSDNEIAGFIRYEVGESGKRYYTTLHSYYHWETDSVKASGNYLFAYLTNEHSAFYILTRQQLKAALASGRYLAGPRKDRYDMLETAATDIYTQCGFKKMICISHLEDFSLHHLPNNYHDKMGLELSELTQQLNALKAIHQGRLPARQLFHTSATLKLPTWDKEYYEPCRHDILALIPKDVKSVLSIGCDWGATEAELINKRIRVTGIPLDPVIGACAEAKGVEVMCPDLEVARGKLADETFDCLLFLNVLQHLPNPMEILCKYIGLLRKNGYLIVSVPNFNHVSVWRKRLSKNPILREARIIGHFEKSRLQYTTKKAVIGWFQQIGLEAVCVSLEVVGRYRQPAQFLLGLMNEALAENIVVLGKRIQ